MKDQWLLRGGWGQHASMWEGHKYSMSLSWPLLILGQSKDKRLMPVGLGDMKLLWPGGSQTEGKDLG